jgi:hypothetical protein
MKYRTFELLSAEDQTAGAGTKTIDIGGNQPISRIGIRWLITKSADGMNSYCHKDITKIELVDGSDVLHSLDGGQNQALCIFDRKCPTMNHGQAITGNSQRSFYGIDFGRYLFDPLLAFDPTKFKNPQLKITYNEKVSDTGASVNNLEVWADCFDEKTISPVGFLTAKNFESWSLSAAGAYHYVDLPTDHIIRKMLIQGYRAQYEPWYQVIGARLSEDNDRRVPFDWNLEDYHQTRKGIDTPIIEQLIGKADLTGTQAFYVTPTDYYCMLAANAWGDDYVYREGVRGGGYLVPYSKNNEIQFQAIVHGWLPNHCYQFPFGDQMDPDDWYDVTGINSLRLRLLSGSGTSGNVDTILQQLRMY